jgi:hypothetical protein
MFALNDRHGVLSIAAGANHVVSQPRGFARSKKKAAAPRGRPFLLGNRRFAYASMTFFHLL